MRTIKQHHKVRDRKFYSSLTEVARKQYNREYAPRYRISDEVGLDNRMHITYCELLSTASGSFDYPISVLDWGCGTGRYFHCLKNVKCLTGVDASLDMLKEARNPVRQSEIRGTINLVCANMFELAFPRGVFDLVYCVGVIGDWCPLDPVLLEKARSMLKAAGKFVFTTIDALSPEAMSWKRSAAYAIRPCLPSFLKRKVNVRLRSFHITEEALKSLMDRSGFSEYEISRRYSPTGRIDLVCVASLKSA